MTPQKEMDNGKYDDLDCKPATDSYDDHDRKAVTNKDNPETDSEAETDISFSISNSSRPQSSISR